MTPRHMSCWITSRTQHVVIVEREPARDRQAALVHRGFPRREVAEVLAVTVADVTDGTRAETDEIAFGMRGVAHEIALQGSGLERAR